MSTTLFYLGCYFFIFGFIGWIVDTVGHLILAHKLEKRGVLFGPITPIYSFGALFIYAVADRLTFNPALLFVVVALACTALEYVVGRLLTTLFHRRWWNYSDLPLNFEGYITLPISLCWGFLGLVQIYVLMKPINWLIGSLNHTLGWWLLGLISAIFIVDIILSAVSVLRLRHRWDEIIELGKFSLYKTSLNLEEKISNLRHLPFGQRRLLHAFPTLNRAFLRSLESVLKNQTPPSDKSEKNSSS